MATVSRPNGASYFTTLPAIDPAVGAKIDQELNTLISTINALDNANIATTPKIAGSKVDLTTAGFLPLAGGDMTGTINHIFDGIFRLLRASGNGRIREYRGSDGAVWGIVYNTYYDEGGATWAGRDITDVCLLLRIKSTGLTFDYAPSAGVGVAPTWTEVFKVDSAGYLQSVNGTKDANGIVLDKFTGYSVGNNLLSSADTVRTGSNIGTMTKIKEIKIIRGGALRIKFDGSYTVIGAATGVKQIQIYRNGVAVGTLQNMTVVNTTYSQDISGWAANDLVQLYWNTAGDADDIISVSNFRLYVEELTAVNLD